MTAQTAPALAADGVTSGYGEVPIVRDVSIRVGYGEIVTISDRMGPANRRC